MKDTELQNKIKRADELRNLEGDLPEAIHLLEPVLVETTPDEDIYYEIILRLSSLYRDNKSYDIAEDFLIDNIDKAKEFNKPIYLADIYRSIAFIELQKRNPSQAKEYAQEAMSVLDNINDGNTKKVKANIYAILGNIEFTLKNYNEALDNYQKSLEESNDINFIQRTITVKNDIANVHIEMGDLEKAKEILLSILQDAKDNYKSSVPQVYMRLARIEFEQLNYFKVKKYLRKSISISEKEGWKRDIAEAREGLSKLYKVIGKPKMAEKELKLAYDIYNELGLLEKAKSVKNQLSI
jgi:tetratricopeptide (TPR) repeat protein